MPQNPFILMWQKNININSKISMEKSSWSGMFERKSESFNEMFMTYDYYYYLNLFQFSNARQLEWVHFVQVHRMVGTDDGSGGVVNVMGI